MVEGDVGAREFYRGWIGLTVCEVVNEFTIWTRPVVREREAKSHSLNFATTSYPISIRNCSISKVIMTALCALLLVVEPGINTKQAKYVSL